LWAAKDKRGYLIDTNGSWAKIDGQRWLRENMAVIHSTYKKASLAYRNRFRRCKTTIERTKKPTNKEIHEQKTTTDSKTDFRVVYSLPPVSEVSEYSGISNQNSLSSGTTTTTFKVQPPDETIYRAHKGSIVSAATLNMNKLYKAPDSISEKSQHERSSSDDSNYYHVKTTSSSKSDCINNLEPLPDSSKSTGPLNSGSFLSQVFKIKRPSIRENPDAKIGYF